MTFYDLFDKRVNNESFQTPATNLDQGEDWTARPSARKPLRYGLDASELTMLKRETVSGAEPEMVCAEPGDVVFFGGFTPHEAGPNRTDGFRRQIFLSYNDSADGEWRAAHYDHFFNYRIRGKSEEERERLFFQ